MTQPLPLPSGLPNAPVLSKEEEDLGSSRSEAASISVVEVDRSQPPTGSFVGLLAAAISAAKVNLVSEDQLPDAELGVPNMGSTLSGDGSENALPSIGLPINGVAADIALTTETIQQPLPTSGLPGNGLPSENLQSIGRATDGLATEALSTNELVNNHLPQDPLPMLDLPGNQATSKVDVLSPNGLPTNEVLPTAVPNQMMPQENRVVKSSSPGRANTDSEVAEMNRAEGNESEGSGIEGNIGGIELENSYQQIFDSSDSSNLSNSDFADLAQEGVEPLLLSQSSTTDAPVAAPIETAGNIEMAKFIVNENVPSIESTVHEQIVSALDVEDVAAAAKVGSSIKVRLDLPSLETVMIDLREVGDVISVASEATFELISSNSESLRETLEQAGVALGDFDLAGQQHQFEIPNGQMQEPRDTRPHLANIPADSSGDMTESSSAMEVQSNRINVIA